MRGYDQRCVLGRLGARNVPQLHLTKLPVVTVSFLDCEDGQWKGHIRVLIVGLA